MRIKFKPITRIKKTIRGKYVTLFYPSKVYEGIKYTDGTIVANSSNYDRPIKVNENDIIILNFPFGGTKKF